MAWRLAKSLETLRVQVNTAYPNRNKKSDGTIGDAAHASGPSDHNPNGQGVVCAFDLTHDPANGCDAHALAEIQRKNPHPNLKYIVSKGRIASRKHDWVWRPSSGHFNHVHFSVGVGSDGKSVQPYDDLDKWDIGGAPIPAPVIKGVPVAETEVFQDNPVKLDDKGEGYADVYHGKGKDPLFSDVSIENGFNGQYPKFRPLAYPSGNKGAFVRVTIVNGPPNGRMTFDLKCDW